MRAVIYCRVSTQQQTKNLSLPAQQKECIRFCKQPGGTVAKVFVERGESAKSADRTELNRLLNFCRENLGGIDVMLVYSLDRFARNSYDHHAVRAHLGRLGMTLRAVTQPIDETPTGKLMEGMLAAIAQFDNDQRAEKTTLGMKEALKRGRWTFPAPLGYRNVHRPDGTKTIEPDPDSAPLIRKAFELYAKGNHSKREVLDQVTVLGLRTRRGNKMSPQSFGQMLKHPLYAGRIRNDKWGIEAKGDFEPIVDEHTFHRVQVATRNAASTGERRYRNNPDFPLRRFVRCGSCEQPLTGSWCRSKTGRRYAYYHCHRCRTVSPRKEALEERFLELLDLLRPKTEYLEALRESVLAVWKQRKQDLEEMRPILETRIAKLEERKRRLVDAYVYEQAIDKQTYSQELARVSQDLTLVKVEHHGNEVDGLDVEAVLEFAEYVVLNSRRLWEEFPLDLRRRMQKVLFPEGLVYDGEAFRTPVTCLFFRDLERPVIELEKVVARTGFEPGRGVRRRASSLRG